MAADPNTEPAYVYDFFLAHAGPDEAVAEQLHRLLSRSSRVFLDSICLLLGDDWDQQLLLAQKQSRITVVLVSERTGRAYYQREEIANAIMMARQDGQAHRVVPLYLDTRSQSSGHVPYGLRLKHGLQVFDKGLPEIAKRLLQLLLHLGPSSQAGSAAGVKTASGGITPDAVQKISGVVDLGSVHYIRRAADELVEHLITTPRSFPYVLEPRQIGKSSLALRSVEFAKTQGLFPVYLDLQLDGARSRRTYEDFATWLTAILAAETGVRPTNTQESLFQMLPTGRKLTAMLESLFGALDRCLLLVLDEVDLLLDTDWGLDFMALLRAWHGRGAASPIWRDRFNVLLIGSSEPHQLIPGTAGSPFNVGIRVTLSDFSLVEIGELASSYGLSLADPVLSFVHEQLGGHPFLTHNLFLQAAGTGADAEAISQLLDSDLLANHIERLRLQLRKNPDLFRYLETVPTDGLPVDEAPATSLYRIGVLRRAGHRVFWRCHLYRDRLLGT